MLDPARVAAVPDLTPVYQCQRSASAEIPRAFVAVFVFRQAAFDVGRDAGVQAAIGAADQVDTPRGHVSSAACDAGR